MADGWRWEYDPSAEHVIGDLDDLAFVARVETRTEEVVRAAAALYLDGVSYQGASPSLRSEVVVGGMFVYQIVPRHQCVYVLQITVL
ncbi:hypothetical protein I5Q34_13345 [Streptomyces sp. AV19]|uniref:hypothetical protein n=1 Tax=Streptomyces sp. AV19 TaxID=2793068 RepID=UPI0018FE2456|nr:hypothetical protein [Streptomyces sp. AV19]MBH1935247.1 hypothetical protein [Streptomyces sp. AV19]MDG4532063.1 hypothetical protein [Streptomyces sp. AV19]